ncbi:MULTISPECIES: reverse transcriptase domain-containing protein [Halomonadaceae]|uniref:reverse transcriptase domain-containing protein n=1 Tax=Halomonadaceae TaxID=28256 RepID=UPI0012EF7A58|nr:MULTISPECIES: reverse transcriptase domain-containing protein [Halomonas]CAD5260809.1 Reverse transcriptase [Halomonas sp. 156]CAD5288200.1 Reverse transcriptase [Halomonas sp. 113]CAD5289653.1 Reverse transcriptase [Halomonas sp. 59]CAD5292582.1 Reverse transcriptase [Halomonas sp. I3]VXB44686.1 Reverse transcriptase [Halomonas titanicae]
MTVTLKTLGIAFRKAKVDLYYSTNRSLFAIVDYEENLQENLQLLQKKINSRSTTWVKDPDFLGTWSLAPKSIRCGKDKKAGLIHASPEQEWACFNKADEKSFAEFRLMAKCSIDFHVLSALWMLKVGHLFDDQLSQNIYGSRLRRTIDNEVNEFSLGSFKSYLKPFSDWRDGAIKTMRTALDDKKKVLALTADVSSFYHRLHPKFMLSEAFQEIAGVELDQEQRKLHQLFINALIAWAKGTPLKTGLPVGLPASAVVANAALIGLDQFIERQVVPLYYGRYVDDVLLVMENSSNIQTMEKFWEWIFSRDGGSKILGWDKQEKSTDKSILFKPRYLENSHVAFENSKNKLFVLSGGPGKALVNAIGEQVNQRASEWRSLPDLPENPNVIATDLLKATNHAGEHADNLRKTDALTLHRAGFALNLRDYEAYERDLTPSAWRAQRHAFFSAVIDHLITPVTFFELAQYLPRVIRMAVACKDFKMLGNILHSLRKLIETVSEDCQPSIKSLTSDIELDRNDALWRWQVALHNSVAENIIAALPPRLGTSKVREWELHVRSHWLRITEALWDGHSMYPHSIKELKDYHLRLFSHDLAHIPLRFVGLPKEMVSRRGIPARRSLIEASVDELLPEAVTSGIRVLSQWVKLENNTPLGLYFSTRPFSLQELYLVAKEPFKQENQDDLGKVVLSLRGFSPKEQKMPTWGGSGRMLRVPDGKPTPRQTIAVASWKTSDKSFISVVMGKADPDSRRRYQRLNRLINELISRPDGAGYLVFPELALPTRWFMRIADKLKGRGISLITGVEYLHAKKKTVRNQVWASLTHDGLGFPSLMIYRQDKQFPALHEEVELRRLSGVKMVPYVTWVNPPIIKHGNFRFALMVCSELTNIRYRGDLRGKVDALFVPEWNTDIDTFNALIESAALDIHAYIIQCNNRTYGDSRIRAPYKDRWKRDVLRVKGGNHDYCITGEIDILALRQFQSCHRSPGEGFKPVPDGFAADMSKDRKVLPKG